MVPKFIMAGGQLVKVLIHTGVANYMEFKPVDGSYVYRKGSAGGRGAWRSSRPGWTGSSSRTARPGAPRA